MSGDGFGGQLSDADRACMHERDERVERDSWPLYRVMFTYKGDTISGYVRATWERLDGEGIKSRWVMLCSGRGVDEKTSIAALRSNLRELRQRRAQHRPMGAWHYADENGEQS